MQNYSVTPMFVDHVDEIVEDIKLQYEKGISVCPLFHAKIHPEGIPATNKTDKICKDFMVFKERLDKLGLPAGFLLQSTIGHGYQLDDAMPYTPFTSMTDGKEDTAYCPLDEGFRKYIKNAVKELAKCHPAVIMIDDDVTVLHWKPGIGGCGCDNHIADFNRRAGTNMTRAELYDYIMSHPAYDPITLKFVESQREALLGAVKAMREGIDEVDPTIQGLISTTGDICEFAKVLAPAFAGKGNPTIVRIGNGSYAPASSLCFSDMLYRTASRYKCLEDSIDMIISEGDTIPCNHYGRDSSFYHSQMTLYSLQGCVGSKLWITNLVNHSPKHDKRFRDVLGGNMPLYNELIRLSKNIEWIGCNQPFELSDIFNFHGYDNNANWYFSIRVFEKMGLPVCFKNGGDKASFISGRGVATWSNKFINELFDKGDVFISSDCLENLIDRGFADRIGVTCREWTGKPISREIYKGISVRKQMKQKELIPISDKVYADSMSYHCELDGSLTPLFPAVTVYPRENGKKTVVFAGSPDVPWTYSTAFAMLCETRKEQFIDLLKSSDALPVYYPDDACVFLTAGYIGNDKMIVVPFNMGWDVLEDFPIWCKHDIKKIEKIEKDATYTEVEFTKTDNNNYSIKNPLGAMLPEVYILHI